MSLLIRTSKLPSTSRSYEKLLPMTMTQKVSSFCVYRKSEVRSESYKVLAQ